MTHKLSTIIDNWLISYKDTFKPKYSNSNATATISVSDAAGKLAFVYEKIRTTIDFKEDHLLRKYAIARMLRRFVTPGVKGSQIAIPLIEELIRARYLPNDKIPESTATVVAHAINRYIVAYNSALDKSYPAKELRSYFNWLIDIASCELEEILISSRRDKITVDAIHRTVRQNIILDGESSLSQTAKNIQIYIAVLKSLIKADETTVNYNLFKYYFPSWSSMSLADVEKNSLNLKHSQAVIRQHYTHSLNEKLARKFKKYTVSFWILQQVIENNPVTYHDIINNPIKLEAEINKVCLTKYKTIGAKVRTAIVRSVIYLFFTKMIFGLLLELPYDYFILHDLQWLPLTINALFPPFLMAAVGMSIRTPKKDNTQAIVYNIANIVYSEKGKEDRIRIREPRTGFGYLLLQALYTILYLISFGFIIYALAQLLFSPISTIIFLVFLTLVSFFSLRIRRTAHELIVVEKKERLLTVIITFLFVPILRVGRWLSLHSSKINVFIFLLDFVIETPFKIFVRIFEDLVIFIREEKEEMM